MRSKKYIQCESNWIKLDICQYSTLIINWIENKKPKKRTFFNRIFKKEKK